MKVLKLTPFFHHPDVSSWPAAYDSVGGMQVQTWRQAMWLAEAGVHQHVMTIGFPGLPKLRALHPNLWVERAVVPMPRIRSEFSGLIGLTQSWAAATLWALLRRAPRPDCDLVHAHFDGQIPALLVAWLAPMLLRRPLVITVHCSRLAVYTPHSTLDMLQHRLARWMERRAIARAKVVMALTQRTAATLSNETPHVVVMPDVVDTEQFARPDADTVAAFRARHGLQRRTVGFVGRIAKEKGWSHLIPLAQSLREDGVHLLIVGDGTQRDRLHEAIDKAGLQDWVTVTGFIPNHAVPVALAACELIVMPSLYEEFGGASIEALAIGTPVVAFAVGGLKEILGGITPGLLVPPGDTQELIRRVRQVLAGTHADDTRPERLRAHVRERYAPDAVHGQTMEVYTSACGHPPLRTPAGSPGAAELATRPSGDAPAGSSTQ
jgi:2-deoxystreptamine N-acetyl-D-glucosaminyltransferase / 2-deoxystreptamine glucosyltransferase